MKLCCLRLLIRAIVENDTSNTVELGDLVQSFWKMYSTESHFQKDTKIAQLHIQTR